MAGYYKLSKLTPVQKAEILKATQDETLSETYSDDI
jgi:hypothetical protein